MKVAKVAQRPLAILVIIILQISSMGYANEPPTSPYILKSGHISLSPWKLPEQPSIPDHNETSEARLALGKQLFFDPRLSADNRISCATCHNPQLGWSDGLPKSKGHNDQELSRASPSIINVGYNSIFMWDGRFDSLEEQALGPLESPVEMNRDLDELIQFLNSNEQYKALFQQAYPNEAINRSTLGKALANYERSIISNQSPFDQWIAGDDNAMTPQQIRGFESFLRTDKGNCAACHHPPNFTDNGFHNIGLSHNDQRSTDPGRYSIKPVRLMKGAFKTPTLRDISLSAPYFHDGSAATLAEVINHYISAGQMSGGLSPSIQPINLTPQDQADLLSFLRALTSEPDNRPTLSSN